MHYVVDEYKYNIFPTAHEYQTCKMAHRVAYHSLHKTLMKNKIALAIHNPDEESYHSLYSSSYPDSINNDET